MERAGRPEGVRGPVAVSRKLILAAAQSPRVRSFVGKHGMRLGAARFVAGETLDECVAVLRRLNEQGLHANTTILGEDVADAEEARAVATEYEGVLQRLHDEELRANVALKLTHLGLDLGEDVAYENVRRLVEKASRARQLHPDRHGVLGGRGRDARHLPPAPRGGALQRRDRPPVVSLPVRGRP